MEGAGYKEFKFNDSVNKEIIFIDSLGRERFVVYDDVFKRYESLFFVLMRAFEQAAIGKGNERHANGLPFDEQIICTALKNHGAGGNTLQICKKAEEIHNLDDIEAKKHELYGVINYAAGLIRAYEMEEEQND